MNTTFENISLFRLDLLTAAFGLLTFNGGLAALAGPPLAGTDYS
jgi:hypothetical protein